MRLIACIIFLTLSQCCLAQHWDSLGTLNRWPTVLYGDSVSDKLYIGGQFSRVNGNIIRGITAWNGSQLDSVGHGFDYDTTVNYYPGNIHGLIKRDSCIYAVGAFLRAGYITCEFMSRWNGSTWDSIPGGQPNGVVLDIVEFNNDLYICGVFDSVGDVSASGVARWDGIAWHAIGPNYPFDSSGILNEIEFYRGNLYLGGNFYDPLGNYCYLAKWNGSTWSFLTSDLQCGIGGINSMKVFIDELYVGGLFMQSSINAGTGIIRWNDTLWRDVGGSLQIGNNQNPTVKDMCTRNGKLYCAGNFEIVGGVSANGLASWDGTQWCGYGTDFLFNSLQSGSMCLAFFRDTLYVGGQFDHVNTVSSLRIAQWIGGNFVDTCGYPTDINEHVDNTISLFPNPADASLTFQFSSSNQKSILLYDSFGRLLLTEQTSTSQHILSVESFAEGIYFYTIVEEGEVKAHGKFVVAH